MNPKEVLILLIYLDESPFGGQSNLRQNEQTTNLESLCWVLKKVTLNKTKNGQ